ncbi:MAG: polynucleotide adenylyltransferase PcnB [Gammaproteobacteria bacterium]|nr:polynucleotide adenylyltransferase PcnB [Gammaproteobacteria bacterium]
MGACFEAAQGRVLYARISRLQALFPQQQTQDSAIEPLRIPRAEHNISRSDISPATLKVLYTLKDAGYEAYIVGGGVRDLLAGLHPKDFDVATNARPEEVKRLFRSCRLVGRRFLIAHVRFGDEIVEVTTFRGPIGDSHDRDETGRILSDNVYGSLEEDAFRRDFTINGLYYDIRDFSIVDYVGGMEDMRRRTLRLIGDPELRYREDPVRMLRAIRIGNKMDFRLDPASAEPVKRLAHLLREIPPARLFDEVLKLLLSKDAVENFRALHWFGLWDELFPDLGAHHEIAPEQTRAFVEAALANTAERVQQDQPVSPSFLFAALLWAPVRARAEDLARGEDHPSFVALAQASEEVMARQGLRVAIPKRFSMPAKEIWTLQPRLEQPRGNRPQRLLTHPRFRAGYDFLLLRAQGGEPVQAQAEWWTQAQAGAMAPLPAAAAGVVAEEAPRKRRRRRRRRGGGAVPQAE